MAVKIIVGGTQTLIDGAVEPPNLWDVVASGDSSDPDLQEKQCTSVWFKFPVHTNLLDAEAELGVVSLDLFDSFYHSLDSLVLGNQIRDELDVISECGE